ncbi:hypothetical protein K435DRAFT_891857 [Dendrothele bispora CBS 962.96]|uniref:Uncharacterized protein n=1 Tax=Dendrothele bispora (strain CBS 962.96) TaxID=1314807 RepID=A0A4S8M4H1_DENBC|nr:hypothetical protein K435DRAFT_891857 [Dendrothele bispora CBS 962.96]
MVTYLGLADVVASENGSFARFRQKRWKSSWDTCWQFILRKTVLGLIQRKNARGDAVDEENGDDPKGEKRKEQWNGEGLNEMNKWFSKGHRKLDRLQCISGVVDPNFEVDFNNGVIRGRIYQPVIPSLHIFPEVLMKNRSLLRGPLKKVDMGTLELSFWTGTWSIYRPTELMAKDNREHLYVEITLLVYNVS